MLLGGSIRPEDVNPNADYKDAITKINDSLQSIFDTVEFLSNPEESPVLQGANLLDLDKSRLLGTDRKAKLQSVRELSNWIKGKSGIVVKDNGQGGVDISISGGFNTLDAPRGSILGDIDYDRIDLTFTGGFMTQLNYYLGGALQETVNMTWNAYGQPVTATSVNEGNTATITYLATGFPERIDIA